MKTKIEQLESKILDTIPKENTNDVGETPNDFIALNFTRVEKLRDEYGWDIFLEALESLESKKLIYWDKISESVSVIRRVKVEENA